MESYPQQTKKIEKAGTLDDLKQNLLATYLTSMDEAQDQILSKAMEIADPQQRISEQMQMTATAEQTALNQMMEQLKKQMRRLQ